MRNKLILPLLLLVVLASTLFSFAQQQSEPKFKLVEFQMALYKRPPQEPQAKADMGSLHTQHFAYITSLLESGQAVIAGPIDQGKGDLRGVSIFKTRSLEEARALAENDPVVKAGYVVIELHPWWSEEVMKKPVMPLKMTTAYLGFLTRGPNWTAEKTPQTEEVQKAHMANMVRLAQMKKLVLGGPFGDNGDLRGIFVFKVGSLDEAKELANSDPAIQAGRLAVTLHEWMVPEGILP